MSTSTPDPLSTEELLQQLDEVFKVCHPFNRSILAHLPHHLPGDPEHRPIPRQRRRDTERFGSRTKGRLGAELDRSRRTVLRTTRRKPDFKPNTRDPDIVLIVSTAALICFQQRVQLTLRKVVRALRERGSSPYAIRPPLPGQPLPKAFQPVVSPVFDPAPSDEASAGQAPTREQGEGVGTDEASTLLEDPVLSVYAQRLEVAVLDELKQALLDMEHEEQHEEQSEPHKPKEGKIENADMEL